MASFPTAVKSFTTKNTGDVIQPAHVNDLQDEVNAIESGYLNGTARLNAAGSTVTSLSVTGNSTLAAIQGGASTLTSLQVTGASTFATRPVLGPPDGVRVNLGSTLAVLPAGGGAVPVYVNWIGAKDFNTNSSIHSSAAESSRLTPQSTGLWRCTAEVEFSTNSTGYRTAQLADSTGTVFGRSIVRAPGSVNVTGLDAGVVQVSGIKYFDALGGWVKVGVAQGDASTLSVTAAWVEFVKL